jgi:hypothetical protein
VMRRQACKGGVGVAEGEEMLEDFSLSSHLCLLPTPKAWADVWGIGKHVYDSDFPCQEGVPFLTLTIHGYNILPSFFEVEGYSTRTSFALAP